MQFMKSDFKIGLLQLLLPCNVCLYSATFWPAITSSQKPFVLILTLSKLFCNFPNLLLIEK